MTGEMGMRRITALVATALTLLFAGAAHAGQPRPWQLGFQDSATPIMERVDSFHDLLLVIIVAICVLVLALLAYVILRFREKRNPTPSKVTHNTMIEVAWTVVPIMILVLISVYSFPLLYYADRSPEAEVSRTGDTSSEVMVVKAIGAQWYWMYEYDLDEKTSVRFSSRLACRGATDPNCERFEKAHGRPPVRLLDTDNEMVIPVGTTVRIQVTAQDVIHAWAVPSFGVKIDAVPGRLNEIWVRATRTGWFYGQCSEICGTDHGFMPISVRVVEPGEYKEWLESIRARAEEQKDAPGIPDFRLIERETPKDTAAVKTDG